MDIQVTLESIRCLAWDVAALIALVLLIVIMIVLTIDFIKDWN